MKRRLDYYYIFEQFDSFNELIDVCDSRSIANKEVGESIRKRSENEPWYGMPYGDARNALLYGYDKHYDIIKNGIRSVDTNHTKLTPKRHEAVVGSTPIVSNALRGLPNSMYAYDRNPVRDKIITLVMDIGVSATVDVQEFRDWGSRMIGEALALERAGHRVKIDCCASFNMYDRASGEHTTFNHVLRVPLKSENNPIDIKRVCFPLAEASFLRRILFDWYERLPNSIYEDGYGKPTYALRDKDNEFKEFIETFFDDNEYYACYGDKFEDVMKRKNIEPAN